MVRITLRLPDKLHARVRKASQRRGVSLNELIVSSLEETFDPSDTSSSREDSVAARAKRLRAMLGNLVVRTEPPRVPSILPLDATAEQREAFRNSMPILDPPLSQTIIEEREDRV